MELPQKSDTPVRADAEQQSFFDAALNLAREAEARAGALEHYLNIADTVVRLIFAGEELRRHFMPALRHLEVPPDPDAGVTFHIWDSETTGVEMLPPPCSPNNFTDRGDIWGWNSARIRSAFHWIEYSVNLMDCETNQGVYWVRTARTLPYWTKASPLRTLLHWWMERNGCQLLHAAAVGYQDGAVLITGKGGVGKSTTALACLASGMLYAGDDYVIVRLDPEPRVYSIYNTAKLNADSAARFPQFQPLITNHPIATDEKAVIGLFPERKSQIVASLPLRAVLMPIIEPKNDTTFRPAAPISLLRAATFTTMSQLPAAGRHTHDYIEALLNRLPNLEICLGKSMEGVAEAIRNLLRMPDAASQVLAIQVDRSAIRRDAPLVSVIIPVYNGARFVAGAIENVLQQNYPAVEIIVVDDGSTDDIASAINRLPVDVRFFRQENLGPASARNRGIRDASGAFIAFLDVDDLWPAGNLERLVECMQQDSDLDVVHGYGQIVRAEPDSGQLEYLGNPRESFPFYIGAGLYRRTAFEKVGLFDTELLFSEDTDWFKRAHEYPLRLERLDQVTLLVRRHDGNMTRGKSLIELNALRVFKKALDRRRAQDQNLTDGARHLAGKDP